jgi:cellulose synthase operon protein YhjU
MGIWNFYFIAKLFLYGVRNIDFHVLPNLAFASLLAIPVRHPRLRLLRQFLAVPAGIALFYYDTWLPPFAGIFSQASQLEGFRLIYLLELAGRFVNPLVIAGLVILYAVYFIAEKKFRRITPLVFLAMLAPLLPILAAPSKVEKLVIPYPTNDTQNPSAEAAASEAAGPSVPGNSARPQSSPPTKSRVPVDDTPPPSKIKVATEPAKSSPQTGTPLPAANDISGPPTDAALTALLNSFYRQEAARTVAFPPKESDTPFDIIFLQICSLSWDDLEFTKERGNALFKRFNIVLTNFSTAATYSGPAAIRALRGSCGQTKHSALYDPPSPQCLTFNNLQKIGFEPQLAMNHDGRFGGFMNDMRERGGMKTAPFDAKGSPPYLQSFDGSPIHDDYTVLSKWWAKRLQAPSASVALFYNSVSLHDGNRYADGRPGNSMEIYRPRLTRLLGDLDHFFTDLQASGRRAVVVFIPEHGAAVRGDKIQIVGMREIPSPRISIVPVGIKLIGLADDTARNPMIVSKPTSYLAVSQLLAGFIREPPFGNGSLNLEKYVRDLPSTEFVAENNDLVVMRRGKQYFIRSKEATWIEYDPSE